jgi:hypothetical protein
MLCERLNLHGQQVYINEQLQTADNQTRHGWRMDCSDQYGLPQDLSKMEHHTEEPLSKQESGITQFVIIEIRIKENIKAKNLFYIKMTH